MGDPEAPDSFNGIIIRVKFWLLILLKLQRFSTIKISLFNNSLCTGKLPSDPLSMLGESIHTAFTFLFIRYSAASSEDLDYG